jgi:cell shape-determining protein MreC
LVLKGGVQGFFGDYAYLFSSKKSLALENVRLKDALDLVAMEGYSREALRKENEDLKLVLGRDTQRSLLLARVLSSVGVMPYDTLVIDVGSKDGVVVGTQVYTDGDFIVGEVTETFLYSAIVTLYSSSGNELRVFIGATSTPSIAYGMGGGNFRSVLPKGIDVKEGDLVEIPDIAPSYLGVVEAVVRSEQSSLQEVYFQWPNNITALRYVYLLERVEPVVAP